MREFAINQTDEGLVLVRIIRKGHEYREAIVVSHGILSEEVSEWSGPPGVLQKITLGFAIAGVFHGMILQRTSKVAL